VVNPGNEGLQARIGIYDPDRKLRIAVRPPVLDLPAGQTAVIQLRIRPRRLRLLGQSTTHSFRVVLDWRDDAPTMVDGAMLQSGIDLRKGQAVRLAASGEIYSAPGVRNGPAGDPDLHHPMALLPGTRHAPLIAKIGEAGPHVRGRLS
jgi:hypothetical protein